MKNRFNTSGLALSIAISVPLDVGNDGWQAVVFGTKAATEYSYLQSNKSPESKVDTLVVSSKSSSGAQVFYFDAPKKVLEVFAQGKVVKGQDIATEVDDAFLRWGVVYAGDRRLNWLERRFASDWIVELDAIAKKIGNGFGHLELAVFKGSTCREDMQLSQRSDYVFEVCKGVKNDDGAFEVQHILQESKMALGLWLSADADNGATEHEVHLTHLGYTLGSSESISGTK